jgi:hypothetical protein
MKTHQLGELFAMPIQSAIRAQNLALQETISFIEQFGLEDGKVKTFHLKAERLVEEREVDSESETTRTHFKNQPFELSIPLLGLIEPPSMKLQEMNVEFGVEVVEPKAEPITSTEIPEVVRGYSFAPTRAIYTPLSKSNPTTMKVNMKILRETPEGVTRVTDILTNLLKAETSEVEPEVDTPSLGTVEPLVRSVPRNIEEVHGIGPETSALLKGEGIHTTTDFLKKTETEEGKKKLIGDIMVSLNKIEDWRKKAKLLEKRS